MDAFNTAHDVSLDLSNAPTTTFADCRRKTKQYAEKQGQGANARANWLLDVVRWAQDGALDSMTRDEDGNVITQKGKNKGKSPGHILYEDYVTTLGKTNVHDEKTITAKASNVNNAIKMGQLGNTGQIDAVAVMNIAMIEHKAMRDAKIDVLPAFEAFNAVIRAQLPDKGDIAIELTRDEIKAAMAKGEAGEKKPKDAGSYLRDAMKAVEKAYELDKSPRVTEALDAVNAALAWCAAEAERLADEAEIARLQAKRAALAA